MLAYEGSLARPEYEVITASSGAEALNRLSERDYAAMLLDIRMPEMDGFEVARRAREQERSRMLPIIFMTAYYKELASIEQGYSLGAIDYLTKPVDLPILRAKVSALIAASDVQRERRALLVQQTEDQIAEVKDPLSVMRLRLEWLLRSDQHAVRQLSDRARTWLEITNRQVGRASIALDALSAWTRAAQ